MKPETEAAVKRVAHALKGLHPRNHPVTVLDDDENPKRGVRTPLAQVDAADVQTLCLDVPLDKLEDRQTAFVVTSQTKGTRRLPAGTMVLVQTQCLWTILRAVAGLEPPAVKDPDPDVVLGPED